jgi:hypothetical protein
MTAVSGGDAVVLRADDVLAIHQVLALYGHVVDAIVAAGAADWEEPVVAGRSLADVFTADAVFDGSATGGGVHRGPAELLAFFGRREPPHPPAHHGTNPYVYTRDGTVRALSKWFATDRETGGSRSGDYEDALVRSPGGWRIARRVVVRRLWAGTRADGSPENPS